MRKVDPRMTVREWMELPEIKERMSTRVRNSLLHGECPEIKWCDAPMGWFCEYNLCDLRRVPNIGKVTLKEYKELLAIHGLKFSMCVYDWAEMGFDEDYVCYGSKTIQKKLKELSEICTKEDEFRLKARQLRESQIKFCKENLIGKCFKMRRNKESYLDKEEYGEYVCFLRVNVSNSWDKTCCLAGAVIRFTKIRENSDWGICIHEESNDATEWMEELEDAEEATIEEFGKARLRAMNYICDMVSKIL